jgi:glutamine synthetase
MCHRERRHLRIDELPSNLSEALDELKPTLTPGPPLTPDT